MRPGGRYNIEHLRPGERLAAYEKKIGRLLPGRGVLLLRRRYA